MYRFKICHKNIIYNIFPTVLVYLKLRDLITESLLLETISFHTHNFSIICLDSVGEIMLDKDYIYYHYPDKCEEKISLPEKKKVSEILDLFIKQFYYSENKFIESFSGFYGYISYDSLPYFENIRFRAPRNGSSQIPKIRLAFFKCLILSNYKDLKICSNIFSKDENFLIIKILSFFFLKNKNHLPFRTIKILSSNITNIDFEESIGLSIRACLIGDVFQIVPSRQYQQKFKGDEFNVYYSLRSITPSPNLFYFDYGDYKIFGSSPEDHFRIRNNTSYIFPIAGTIITDSDDLIYEIIAKKLTVDTKEHAEHVMLVDLARNDLSKNSSYVKIEKYKELKTFNNILHLETKVSGGLPIQYSPVKIFTDTFPTGTLSGCPKYKAIELLDEFESQVRGVYGGSIVFFSLDGLINTAIIIRVFVSKGKILFMQAGVGVLADSIEKDELQEGVNKLNSMNKSIIAANEGKSTIIG